jgi:hypothetical protein
MNRLLVALALLVAVVPDFASSASTKPVAVTFSSPCLCQGAHHKDRWSAKTDAEVVPDSSKITAITPSKIYNWRGVGTKAGLTRQSKRIASEERWFSLTGRVVDVRIEGDGDIHVALKDAEGHALGTVGVEIPPTRGWCKIRRVVFGWTTAKFPLKYPTHSKLDLREDHVITITGKAFYDVDHAPADRSNERPKPFAPGYAVWEIHPAMLLTVNR